MELTRSVLALDMFFNRKAFAKRRILFFANELIVTRLYPTYVMVQIYAQSANSSHECCSKTTNSARPI